MNTRRRVVIVFSVLTVFFVPGLLLLVFSALDVVVAKDPRITDAVYRGEWDASGTLATESGELTIGTRKGQSGWEMVVNPGNRIIPLDEEGKVRGSDAFTPFWIYMKNPVISTVREASRGYEAPLVDSLNLLGGGSGARYTIRTTAQIILWSPLLQSQASYRMGIYDSSGVEAATAVIDATCGFLFELETHRNGAGRLSLQSTSFPISRNRYFLVEAAVVTAMILIFVFLLRYSRSAASAKNLHKQELKLVIWGVLACFADIYADVWWPFAFGPWGLLALHAVVLVLGAIWYKWWILPGIIELLWGAHFAIQTELMIPQLTHSPGLIISWMMVVLFTRTPRRKLSL